MFRRVTTVAVLIALAVLTLGGPSGFTGAARAQTALPVTPDPSQCAIEPVTTDELAAFSELAPAAEEVDEEASPEPFTLPTGDAADDETTQAVTEVIVAALACINAGDYFRFIATFSDDFIIEELAGDLDAETIDILSTPEPVQEDLFASMLAIRDVVVLEDGSVGALVDTAFPDDEPVVQVDYFTFVEQDGEWKIDGITEDLEEQFPSEVEFATPAA